MWHLLVAIKRSFVKKSSRVADENMMGDGNGAEFQRNSGGWNLLSVLENIIQVPISFLTCIAEPDVRGADGMWASGELGRTVEINHLLVSDGMRYAILM